MAVTTFVVLVPAVIGAQLVPLGHPVDLTEFVDQYLINVGNALRFGLLVMLAVDLRILRLQLPILLLKK